MIALRRAILRAQVSFLTLVAAIGCASAANIVVPAGTTQGPVTLASGDTLDNQGAIETTTGILVTGADGTVSVTNAGQIRHTVSNVNNIGLLITGDLGSFANTGDIVALGSTGGIAASILGDVNLFSNEGTITGGFGGAFIGGTVGDRFTNSGTISGVRGGAYVNSGTVINTGTLLGTATSGISTGLGIRDGQVTNSGTMRGWYGIVSEASATGGIEVINSGTIEGTGGTAIDFGFVTENTDLEASTIASGPAVGRDDILRVLPGSSITGAVDFGEHVAGDLLDLSEYSGTLLLNTVGLELIQTDDGAPVDFASFTAAQNGSSLVARDGGQIAVVDAPVATGGGSVTASSVAAVTGEISSIISSQLSGLGTGAPGTFTTPTVNAYAASPENSAATAVLSALDVEEDYDNQAWASAFGGLAADNVGTPLTSVFGGIVAGSHARVSGDARLGLLGGYVRSLVDVSKGGQVLDSHMVVAGVYGQAGIDFATIDLSVLAGYSLHHSQRASGGSTAVADFTSLSLAPEGAVTVPVLSGDGHALNVTARAKYVGGAVAAYTETGGLVNLTVGQQPISLLDLRTELNGHVAVGSTQGGDVLLTGSAGVFGQSNLGGSSVPVTVLGQQINSVTPGSVAYGVYGAAGLTAPLTASANLGVNFGGSARSDGLLTGVGKLQLTADF